jgi:16S rRNA (cytosine1402-N4)-methyltransferase
LDMRMDQGQSLTAAGLVNELSEMDLAKLLWELGDEPASRKYARAIVQARERSRLKTTGELARLIERLNPRRGSRVHPATRVFQALRMAVNDEVRSLESGLAAAWNLLRPGGRLAVISFHSVEDRLVKEFGRERARDYAVQGEMDLPEFRVPRPPDLKLVTRKPLTPTDAEVTENPRARSAKMRVFERLK